MSPGAIIGTLSAAMRSGLPAKHFEGLIDGSFTHNSALMKRVLAMYEGCDWDLNLWHLQPSGFYKLATTLCRPGQATWRYDGSKFSEEI
jgi:hypothetical protein